MVISLNIVNHLNHFFKMINHCDNPVHVLTDRRQMKDLRNCPRLQKEIRQRFNGNSKAVTVTLKVTSLSDYLTIIYYHIGMC